MRTSKLTLHKLLMLLKASLIILCWLPKASFSIEVTDFLNRTVKLEQPAKRIVALAPHIVENLYTAGAGEYIVGAVDYCDYPPSAVNIPRVGAITSYSYEAIVELNPDIVITWHSGHGSKALNALKRFGIPVYASNPKSLEDVAKAIRDFGILTNNSKTANQQAKNYEEKLASLKKQYAEKNKLKVLYQVWNAPLQTLNDQHIISDVIRMCGAANSFGDAVSVAPKISIESVLAKNPDVIIASGMGEARPAWLDEWKHWPSLKAVQNKNLYFVPPDIIQRHTYRILEGAEIMCEHIDKARQNAARHTAKAL